MNYAEKEIHLLLIGLEALKKDLLVRKIKLLVQDPIRLTISQKNQIQRYLLLLLIRV